eukprot:571510-Rhodomonas_salina.1
MVQPERVGGFAPAASTPFCAAAPHTGSERRGDSEQDRAVRDLGEHDGAVRDVWVGVPGGGRKWGECCGWKKGG